MLIQTIDKTTLWGWHYNSTVTPIGGVPPLESNCVSVPGKDASWVFSTSGNSQPSPKNYPAVEFYPSSSAVFNGTAIPFPISQNTGNVSFEYDLTIDENTTANANVIETDLLIVTGGMKYNLSGQRHVATGQIDIGNWTPTTLLLGALTANVKHRVKWTYSFDVTEKTCSVLSYECDEVVNPITTTLNMPAIDCNWPEGVYVQVQLGSLPAGLSWSIKIGSTPEIAWW